LAFRVRRKDLPDTKVGTLTQALYEAKKKNWTGIGMKNEEDFLVRVEEQNR
jgi:hypothetical protein